MSSISPKITVLMSVYNSEKYLAESIDSILSQTFKEFEFVIINDGSTDLSLAILELYAQKDCRIRIVNNNENLGLIASLNKGITLASCDLIARMDADDVAMPERLALQYNFMINNPSVSVCGTAFRHYEFHNQTVSLPVIHDEIFVAFLFFCPIAHPAVIYRKNEILEIGCYDKNDLYAEDFGLWLKMLASKQYVFANLDQHLLNYRIHPTQTRKDYKNTQSETTSRIRLQLLKELGVDTDLKTVAMLENIEKCSLEQVNKFEKLLNDLDKIFKYTKGYDYFKKHKAEKILKARKKIKAHNLTSTVKKLSARIHSKLRK